MQTAPAQINTEPGLGRYPTTINEAITALSTATVKTLEVTSTLRTVLDQGDQAAAAGPANLAAFNLIEQIRDYIVVLEDPAADELVTRVDPDGDETLVRCEDAATQVRATRPEHLWFIERPDGTRELVAGRHRYRVAARDGQQAVPHPEAMWGADSVRQCHWEQDYVAANDTVDRLLDGLAQEPLLETAKFTLAQIYATRAQTVVLAALTRHFEATQG